MLEVWRGQSGHALDLRWRAGEQVDANGLIFLRARYYNPAMGRFFQRDKWKGDNNRPQSLNPYVYGLNSPTRYKDLGGDRPCNNDGPWGCGDMHKTPGEILVEIPDDGDPNNGYFLDPSEADEVT